MRRIATSECFFDVTKSSSPEEEALPAGRRVTIFSFGDDETAGWAGRMDRTGDPSAA